MKKLLFLSLFISCLFALPPQADASVEIDGVVIGGVHNVIDHPYLACVNSRNGLEQPLITVINTDSSGAVVFTKDSCNGPVREEVLITPQP